jgi:hypothetical protein
MSPLYAWLPFLVSLTVAFVTALAFPKACMMIAPWPYERRQHSLIGAHSPEDRARRSDLVAGIGLILLLLVVWGFAAMFVMRLLR